MIIYPCDTADGEGRAEGYRFWFCTSRSGSAVKGQYAGCLASGQPLTEATRKDPFLRSGSTCAPLPASRRGEESFVRLGSKVSDYLVNLFFNGILQPWKPLQGMDGCLWPRMGSPWCGRETGLCWWCHWNACRCGIHCICRSLGFRLLRFRGGRRLELRIKKKHGLKSLSDLLLVFR